MKCIFLCAGYATRLFPITENFPKALIEVGGKPIIDYILEKVNKIDDIEEIYLVTNAKYTPHFQNWANERNNMSSNTKKITVFNDGTTNNDDRLGAIGDINFTIESANINDDIMVLATDNLFDFELKDFYEFYKTKNAPCVCVREEEDINLLKRVGVAKLDEDLKIIDFVEKPANPQSKFAVFAEYIYPKNVLPEIKTYLEEGNSCDAPGNLVAYMYKKMPTYAYEFKGECYDVGTHDALALVNEIYNKKNND